MVRKPSVRPGIRFGLSLLELLVCIAIIAVIFGLLLGAVQSARLSAARAAVMNDMRQVVLATHHFADAEQGWMPNVSGEQPRPGYSVIRALCPFMEADPNHPPPFIRFKTDPSLGDPLPPGATPLPPAGVAVLLENGECSLAFNPLVYAVNAKLALVAPDGHSSTIALTEHYGVCGPTSFNWRSAASICQDQSGQQIPCVNAPTHRATFADGAMFDDVVPVTTVRQGVATTVGSLPMTFQVRPPLSQCDPRVPQSSFQGGILVGMMDGSVRFLNARIQDSVFWASVTPDRGETALLD